MRSEDCVDKVQKDYPCTYMYMSDILFIINKIPPYDLTNNLNFEQVQIEMMMDIKITMGVRVMLV